MMGSIHLYSSSLSSSNLRFWNLTAEITPTTSAFFPNDDEYDLDHPTDGFASIPEAIEDIRQGKLVIVVDDEDRENEGDLIMAASKATPEAMAFIVKHGTGIVCVSMKGGDLERLELPLMVTQKENEEKLCTAFTVSVDAKHGTTTGVSAHDRATTVLALASRESKPEDFNRPGHIFPLKYREGGVLKRAGHTEASVDLAMLAGLEPVAVLCEIVDDDGSMARLPRLRQFAQAENLKIISIADLIRYRRKRDRLVELSATAPIPTMWGPFKAYCYRSFLDGIEHIAMVKGEIGDGKDILVRVHSECLTGDIFGSARCDCGNQLALAMKQIEAAGRVYWYTSADMKVEELVWATSFVLTTYRMMDVTPLRPMKSWVYLLILVNMALVHRQLNSRSILLQILRDLGVHTMRLMTNNPAKYVGLKGYGLAIAGRVPLLTPITRENRRYLETKREKMGHIYGSDSNGHVFTLEGDFDWERIHRLVLREIRRLEDGLPIYSHRQEILRKICGKQVIVLVGETGSGKSTQLVQFLADSGIAANESIICIQPRKIAAISIADRVREESIGCYEDNSIISLPTFSSTRQIDSKVVYMTDHCLLQYCMNDRSLSGISCVIVDEAHERSLNTDLLLAVIKGLLLQRFDLRLKLPVDVRYIPYTIEETASGIVAPYVFEAVRMTMEVHKTEKEGTILAFLTSQMEVEWACEEFETPSAVALPLHESFLVKSNIVFSKIILGKEKLYLPLILQRLHLQFLGSSMWLTLAWSKRVIDPVSGMNVLRVCRINQSSALQRAGRAGRTGPGICYRLYSEHDYDSMSLNQEPEIRRVHLGVAVLRVLALGVRNIQDFDFVDAPSAFAIDMATRNLVQLGAITKKNDVYELTEEGCYLVKLGIEPCRGKLILSCFHHGLGKEGIVLAAVMANSSSIFCRVGNDDNKLKADCLKVQFCHHNGDLFTLLCVYREWESLPRDRRNKWCWENSINAKTMRRCQESVKELEICLEKELHVTIPTDWHWNPHKSSEHDKNLKQAILSALAENVAMYSGCDKLGYQVALTGKHVQLHPSCSLLIFGDKPSWVVFGELLSTFSQYLVCVTAFDFESLCMIFPPPLFDALKMESQKLQVKVMTGFGNTLLKKLCGKSNNNLLSLVSGIQSACEDEQIVVEVNVHQNEILLFATSEHMEKVFSLVKEAVEYEQKRLRNECMEKCLYHGVGVSPSVALFGAGAEIKHLELESRCLTVDIFLFSSNTVHDRELLMFLEKFVSGGICAVHKSTGFGQDGDVKDKWGKVLPSQTTFESDHKMFSFPAVKAKVYWPRRCSKGFAVVKCDMHDVESMMCDFSIISIRGKNIRCEVSRKSPDSIIISRIDRELFEDDVLDVLRGATRRRILGFFIVRGDAVENPARGACEEALLREISSFMPKSNPHTSCCRVQVLLPEPKDAFMRALITFDGRLHMEAAKALEHMEGKVLPGCLSWQKIKCQQLFHTSLSCSASVYFAIEKELNSLLASFKHLKGVEFSLEKNENSSYRVRISANATRTVAELRRPLEELMKGRIINHASLTPTILTHLFSRQGINLMKSIQRETKTYILFDRWNFKLRIFGSSDNVAFAQQKLIQSLLTYHESRRLEIHLRGGTLPPDMMKKVVKKFGPDLYGLKERVPEAEFTLSTRGHVIYIHGSTESKQKVEEIIFEIAQTSADSAETLDDEATCPICLCEVEDGYRLEDCGHFLSILLDGTI
ncbi:hypothetical protein GH714_017447 [Hevea brasiliensis]|uniref:Uncharacterized protein n=1 Tax=Hevea brasiliensis TaxID=3981 RepID=A0A6A6K6V0_HEVBR|nr:hypothetical protein GH714_017447 [Hevea brasiliensis]